jgi:predicted O-linked N-acetylglucosamine transferase (SPINDLY family)
LSDVVEKALALHRAGRLADAEALYRSALAANAANPEALRLLCVLKTQQGKHEEALPLAHDAVRLEPASPKAHAALGAVQLALRRHEDAVASYRNAAELAPDVAANHYNLGVALQALGRHGDALESFGRALALEPRLPEALANRGNALIALGRPADALADLDKALALRPGFPEALVGRGTALYALDRHEEALAAFDLALSLRPDSPKLLLNRGCALEKLGRRAEALAGFERALAVDPEDAQARWSLAMCQLAAGFGAAGDAAAEIAAFSQALDELDRWFSGDRVERGVDAVGTFPPFYLAYRENDNTELLRRYGRLCARIMAAWLDRRSGPPAAARDHADVIRVGVVSAHFRDHSVWNAVVKGWFQQLDRARFALHAFHLGTTSDQETLLARSRASRFEEGPRSLDQWVDTIAAQRPDVLIYPEIGMDAMTVRLAAMRLAPVQIASWGHPETTGLPTIDYFLSAEDMEPPGADANYVERLVALPHLGCSYEPAQTPARDVDLATLGIAPDAPILVCPGTPFKYDPRHDRILIDIARRLGRCSLVFFTVGDDDRIRDLSARLQRRLRGAFAGAGLNGERSVMFLPWLNRPSFHGLMKRADACLDTIGFSGFNTAMQSVEWGLPVVAWEGRFLRGRLASGIMKRIGLPELVARSEGEYVAIAVRLCREADFRARMRERIAAGRHVLFGDEAPIRALEEFLAAACRTPAQR